MQTAVCLDNLPFISWDLLGGPPVLTRWLLAMAGALAMGPSPSLSRSLPGLDRGSSPCLEGQGHRLVAPVELGGHTAGQK